MSDLEYSAMSQEQLLLTVQDKDAEIERLYELRDRWTELIEEHEAEIKRLECDLAISRGKHTNAIAEIERLEKV
jgi:hypothetical protein